MMELAVEGGVLHQLRNMSREDRRAFDGWLKVNAAAGLVAAGRADSIVDALPIAAVLRSWEERFGAKLLTIGFAKIQLLAHRPPRTQQAAQLLAAEQFAFCDECADKGLHDVSSITDHLLRSPIWTFWWD